MGFTGVAQDVYFPGRKGAPVQGGVAVSNGLVIPEDEQEKLKFLAHMFQTSAQYRARWDKHWPRFWNLWEGNHYYARTVHTLTRAVINQIFSTVETFVGHVADVIMPPNLYAREAALRMKAKLITKWLKAEWDQSGAEYEMQHVVRSSAATGVGWIEMPWDQTKKNGRGGVGFIPRDEKFMFISPHARELNEALYLLDASNVPREYVENCWERGKDVPAGIWFPQVNNQRVYTGASPEMDSVGSFLTTDGSQSGSTTLAGAEQGQSKELVTLIKAWIRQQDGTMRLLVVSNGLILQDGPSPYEDDDFPYVKLNLLPTLDGPYGRSLIQFIEGLQEVIDNSLSYMLDVQRFAADPMLAVSATNLEEGHIIENMPGAILADKQMMAGGGQGYYWLQGPGFNQSWMQILESVIQAMDSVLGRVDVLKGEKPAGVNTLGGLEIIRDEANVRVRNLIRWVRAAVKKCYVLMLSRLRQFVHSEQTMRVANKKNGKEEFITVNPIVGQTLEGQPVQEETIPEGAEFDFDFGPEEPGGQQASREAALELMNTMAEDGLPVVDRAYVLDKYGVEEAEEIIKRFEAVKQQQAEAAQAEAQAQAQQGPVDPVEQDPMRAISELFGS